MNTYHCTFAPNSDPDNIQRETLLADNIQQIERVYQANDCTLLHFHVKAETIEVAWNVIPDCPLCGDTGRGVPTLQDPDGECCICTRDSDTVTKPEQTYQEFQSLATKYAPKPMTPHNDPETCNHRRVYPRTDGMYCPDCWTIRPAANDFEKRTSAPHRDNGYVNWRMR